MNKPESIITKTMEGLISWRLHGQERELFSRSIAIVELIFITAPELLRSEGAIAIGNSEGRKKFLFEQAAERYIPLVDDEQPELLRKVFVEGTLQALDPSGSLKHVSDQTGTSWIECIDLFRRSLHLFIENNAKEAFHE